MRLESVSAEIETREFPRKAVNMHAAAAISVNPGKGASRDVPFGISQSALVGLAKHAYNLRNWHPYRDSGPMSAVVLFMMRVGLQVPNNGDLGLCESF
jgi:hypothetical protein